VAVEGVDMAVVTPGERGLLWLKRYFFGRAVGEAAQTAFADARKG
jgi:hypothetical protein